MVGNPWYSERNQREFQLRAARPAGLPEQSPGSETAPLLDGRDHGTVRCIGKGRGSGQSSGKAEFVTPPSRKFAGGTDDSGLAVKQSQGMMPVDPRESLRSMGKVPDGNAPEPPVDELQRALEIEVVNQLREQNATLMSELDDLRRQLRNSPHSGLESFSSWVEIPGDGVRERRDGRGVDDGGSATPRTGVKRGHDDGDSKYTPNGTKVPEGSPPKDQQCVDIPQPPPMPPFPMEVQQEDTATMLDQYEISQQVSKIRSVDPQ
eukprot:s2614_g8.t1